MRWAVVVAVGVVACGGGDGSAPDATGNDADPGCAVVPLPEGAPLSDPLAMPLPDDCVTGGASQMIGRWFTESDDHSSIGAYLRFDAGCGGVREHLVPPSELTATSRHDTWFDDTRVFIRDEYHFGPDTSDIIAISACALPTGELATVEAAARVRPGFPITPLFDP